MSTEQFKMKDILYGLVVPILVALLILFFATILKGALEGWFPAGDPFTGEGASPYSYITTIFTHGIAMMVMFGVPLILGLLWNKWAGGAAGFIMGTLYYLAMAGYNIMYTQTIYGAEYAMNLYADPSFIGNYIVGGILIGYITGALSNKSFNFKRMIGAGMTAALAVGVMQFLLNYTISFGAYMTQADPVYALFITLLPMVILGIIGPIIAKVMMWYGLLPGGYK